MTVARTALPHPSLGYPINGRVLLRRIAWSGERRTGTGSLIVPESCDQDLAVAPWIGEVLAIADDIKDTPIKVGDHVQVPFSHVFQWGIIDHTDPGPFGLARLVDLSMHYPATRAE